MMGDSNMDLNGIISGDITRKHEKAKQRKEISFKEYLELVEKDPLIAQNSPSRLLEMVLNAGTEEIPQAEQWFDIKVKHLLWKNLYGSEKGESQFVNLLNDGKAGLPPGKMIALLVGPPASGKSTFVSTLMRALENYNLRPVYQIKDCQMFDEPLKLLPRYLREGVALKPEDCPEFPNCKGKHLHLGVKVEGDICPHCRHMLQERFTNKETEEVNWWDVPIQTLSFSIQGSRGLASFEPSDEKSSDVTELVGQVNIPIWSTKGPNHPLAYSLTGELEKANRGVFEGRELIKADEKLLWVFISVASGSRVKK